MSCSSLLRAGVLLALFATATFAEARTTLVSVGPGTPLQDAIAAASPGDTLQLFGTFYEPIVIDKPLRIVQPGKRYVQSLVVPCDAPYGIHIRADRVKLRGVGVTGASAIAILVENANNVRIRGTYVHSPCPTRTTGIEIVGGSRVTVEESLIASSEPSGTAAIRVRDLAAGARHVVRKNGAGRIGGFPDLAPGDALQVIDAAPGSAIIKHNSFHSRSGNGVSLINADGVHLHKNALFGAAGEAIAGIRADSASEDNLITGNEIQDFEDDVLDLGTGNCWRNNSYFTGSVPACP